MVEGEKRGVPGAGEGGLRDPARHPAPGDAGSRGRTAAAIPVRSITEERVKTTAPWRAMKARVVSPAPSTGCRCCRPGREGSRRRRSGPVRGGAGVGGPRRWRRPRWRRRAILIAQITVDRERAGEVDREHSLGPVRDQELRPGEGDEQQRDPRVEVEQARRRWGPLPGTLHDVADDPVDADEAPPRRSPRSRSGSRGRSSPGPCARVRERGAPRP